METSREKESNEAAPLQGLVEESVGRLVSEVQSHPFRTLGYAFAAGIVLATPPGRALALRFLTRKGSLNFL